MIISEIPLTFPCNNQYLVGILCKPEKPRSIGIVIVVGGPQYRAGSHRQFTLLARAFAEAGYPTLRFDYRGMGDSDGETRAFDTIDEDIKSAVDVIHSKIPEVNQVVIWGLCDAASAGMIYAHTDPRIKGLVLANPWVRTSIGENKAIIKYYYLTRLTHLSFWRKLLSGNLHLVDSISEFIKTVCKLLSKSIKIKHTEQANGGKRELHFIEKMLLGLTQFNGQALILLSGNDLVAHEFKELISQNENWKRVINDSRILSINISEANHTFASRQFRQEIISSTLDWLNRLI